MVRAGGTRRLVTRMLEPGRGQILSGAAASDDAALGLRGRVLGRSVKRPYHEAAGRWRLDRLRDLRVAAVQLARLALLVLAAAGPRRLRVVVAVTSDLGRLTR